jgi:glycosyltransferase involved in cell wall biosynthesis
MAAPLISVVIPCYNHARYLREAVNSIETPSRPVEVVIVDDGSTDGSGDIADACAREKANGPVAVRVVHQPNAGVAAARNRGFAESSGELVVFLDSDDHLAPGALDIGARALDEHPEAVFVYGRCQMMSADGTLLPTPRQPRIERRAYLELLRQNYIWTPANVMFRRHALERCGTFNQAMSGSADFELYLRIARTYPIHDHGQLVAHYRRHDTNIRSNAAQMLREMLTVLRSQWPYVDGDPDGVAAYRDGYRHWREFYGTLLVIEIRSHARAREWVPAVQKAITLGVLHPRALVDHRRLRVRRASAIGASG